MILKKFDVALEAFEKLVRLAPENKDFISGLEDVKNLIKDENSKKKNLYKKMIFSDD